MDALTVLSNALLAGAAAAAKPMAELAVTDAYRALTALFHHKWGGVPAAEAGDHQGLAQAIQQTDAVKDPETLRAAQTVLTAVSLHDPAAAASVGIQVSDLDAGGSVAIEDLLTSTGPITVSHITAGKNIRIKGVGNPRMR